MSRRPMARPPTTGRAAWQHYVGAYGLQLLECLPTELLWALRDFADGELELRARDFARVEHGLADRSWR